jgi:hypothetical protein
MTRFECPFCDSAFLKFINSESELRQHVLVAHGRILDFGSQDVKIPASDAKDYVRIGREEKEPSSQSST